MRFAPLVPILLLPLLLTSCAYVLRSSDTPTQQALAIRAASPTNLLVRVGDVGDFVVGGDGHVVFPAPRLRRRCDTYVFGFIWIPDRNPENVRAIHLVRDGKVVRRLSLREIGKLPEDSEGYHILVLK